MKDLDEIFQIDARIELETIGWAMEFSVLAREFDGVHGRVISVFDGEANTRDA